MIGPMNPGVLQTALLLLVGSVDGDSRAHVSSLFFHLLPQPDQDICFLYLSFDRLTAFRTCIRCQVQLATHE
ncbi:hypothetical protein K440DRAFT_409989 [Wilcoxina mikolae CBS 423.85]|nr:hypothetical protein K440DRAFT_409989 [Wilcoxina mikolae CBS 423.85]